MFYAPLVRNTLYPFVNTLSSNFTSRIDVQLSSKIFKAET